MNLTIPALHRSYPDNSDFHLETPQFDIPGKGYTCIIGSNGSGKSSFGEALAQIDQEEPWFYLPQFIDRFLFDENLVQQLNNFLSEPVNEDELKRMVEELGFKDPATMIRFPFILMSGGERRRIALASVFYLNPSKIILDEPEIGVTEKENMVLLSKIRNLKAIDTGVIIISHSYEIVKESSSLICLKQGLIDKYGNTSDLVSDPGFDLKSYGVRFGSDI